MVVRSLMRYGTGIVVAVGLVLSACGREPQAQPVIHANEAASDADASKPGAGFVGMDANRDGSISADEHATGVRAMFTVMDTDKNGSVTTTEMDAAQGPIGGSSAMSSADKIKVIDTNGDGLLAEAEHVAGAKSMFGKMDTDRDGALSHAEFDAGHKAMLKTG